MDLVLTRESKGSSESEPETELIKELVGAIITPVEGSSVEAIKAGNPMVGDTIEYNGYIYKYGQMSDNLGNWSNIDISQHGDGWGVKVQDTTLATYPDMESTIYSKPVKFLYYTFINCENMVTAPRLSDEAAHMAATFSNCSKLTITPIIPDSVTNMIFAFAYCTSLTTVQNIPSNVTVICCTFQKCTKLTTIPELPNRLIDMDAAFDDCTLLTSVSTIPATVTNLNATFRNCTSLEGTITINATSVSDYSECFKGTSKSITLAKTSCPVLSEIAATATGGNVIVAE